MVLPTPAVTHTSDDPNIAMTRNDPFYVISALRDHKSQLQHGLTLPGHSQHLSYHKMHFTAP